MGKKQTRTKVPDLSDSAIVERALSLANDWMWAVSLQHDRIARPRKRDVAFHPFGIALFNEADVHFLTISLRRLRIVVSALEHVPELQGAIRAALEAFDTRLPWVKSIRDVFEHLEDYAIDSNRRKSDRCRRELQVWSATENDVNWLGFDIDWREALLAAENLHGSAMTAIRIFADKKSKED
ncbi:hypothetical protein [Dokdonella fugitiva]|jgi:hypothetical protein|uniref:hypothetical protein n=1 Tax=Dokdonella fugitiva TaxID=328517 RepID=UPI00104B580B|nr:hypothetical protein [Dokdonella fugitiva]